MTTKRDIIEAAFSELGISNNFDVDPVELTAALGKLNGLMSAWNARNIRVGYVPGTDIDAESGIGDTAEEAVKLNLALRLCPGVGKVPSPDLKRDARLAYLALLTQTVEVIPVQLPSHTPAGAGNRRFTTRNFLQTPTAPVDVGSGGAIDGVDLE